MCICACVCVCVCKYTYINTHTHAHARVRVFNKVDDDAIFLICNIVRASEEYLLRNVRLINDKCMGFEWRVSIIKSV